MHIQLRLTLATLVGEMIIPDNNTRGMTCSVISLIWQSAGVMNFRRGELDPRLAIRAHAAVFSESPDFPIRSSAGASSDSPVAGLPHGWRQRLRHEPKRSSFDSSCKDSGDASSAQLSPPIVPPPPFIEGCHRKGFA